MHIAYAGGVKVTSVQAIGETKVVKLVTLTPPAYAICMAWAYHTYFTKSISLIIWIQITIHPLSTDGAIVI